MGRNIIEKAIVPHNPSTNTVIYHERYNLFVPAARLGDVSIASFDAEDFSVMEGKVRISEKFKSIIPLVVDEVLIVGGTSDEIDKEGSTSGYTNFLDAASFSRRPEVEEVFWCIVKSCDNYLYTALARVTGEEERRPNGSLMYPFELIEAIEIYDPTKTLHTPSDIPNGNLVKWDAENEKLVDAGGSLGDISTALDNIIAIQKTLIGGDSV
jgi:hypothetical protein